MYNLLAQVTGRERVMLYSPQDTLHFNLMAKFLHVHTHLFTFTTNLVSGDKSEGLAIDCSDLGWFPEFVKAWWYWCTRTWFFQSLVWAGWMMKVRALFKSFGMGVNIFWCHLPAEGYNKNDPYGKCCSFTANFLLPKRMNQTPGSYSLGHLHTVAKHFKPMATELK
uniref:Uncharacterized protein n=1 Tax=Oncorhynchus kisutch TaxID=8019 RepID=A0A8C7DKY8_ONCKI